MQKNNRVKYFNKSIFLYFTILFAITLLSGCYFSTAPSNLDYAYDRYGLSFPINKKLYISHDLWYDNPMDISSMNYQTGKVIPFGTEVKFIKSFPNYILFETLNDKKQYKVINNKEISLLDNESAFHQIFSDKDPNSLTKDIKPDILSKLRLGKIEIGMTRYEVLLALGPPPIDMNPKNYKNTWIYFINSSLKTTHYVFKDNKITYIFGN